MLHGYCVKSLSNPRFEKVVSDLVLCMGVGSGAAGAPWAAPIICTAMVKHGLAAPINYKTWFGSPNNLLSMGVGHLYRTK